MNVSFDDLPAANLDDRMRLVRSACEHAPVDARRSVSLRRYLSAEHARSLGDDAECIRRLDAALKALK